MTRSEPTIAEPLRAAFDRLERLVPGFEHRAGQLEMARLWTGTLDRTGLLAVEAPTGIGKSLAYLLPALLLRVRGSGPIVVSTHTKALQDQLLTRDAPLAVRAIGKPLRVTMLKGRQSYLCRRRASSRMGQRRLFAGYGIDDEALERLEHWVERTTTGELEELHALGVEVLPSLLAELGSDPGFCSGSGCDPQTGCFAKLARREARKADLLVINHALLLSDAGLRNTIIAEAGALVVDEAHHLERVAREQLGVSLGVRDLARLAGRTDARSGALRLLKRGRSRRQDALSERIAAADAAIPPVLAHAAALARDLEPLLPHGAPTARLTREVDLAQVSPAALDQLLAAIGTRAPPLAARADPAESEGGVRPEAHDAIEEVRARLAAWIEVEHALRAVTRLEERGVAFYLDRDEQGAPRLNRRPIRVGEELRSQLFERSERTLLTSATLAVGGDFEPLIASLGLGGASVQSACLPTPFPLERQVFCAVLDGPAPGEAAYVDRLAEAVVGLATRLRRNALVLLTSYQMLEQLAGRIRAPLDAAGIRLLKQAPGEAAAPIAREFRSRGAAVLLGAASFWEGVDFPGAELEVLVVARLPFPVPTDPVVEARSEQIEAEGGDAFRDLMVPEAVLRFRQGVGRLIRSAEDRGAVVVADPRILRSAYGTKFLAAMPAPPVTAPAPERLIAAVRDWFEREGVACPA